MFLYFRENRKKKIEEIAIEIKKLYLKKNENEKNLQLLSKYEKEYILKINNYLISGIFIYKWKNYNSFIFLLGSIIRDNKIVLKKNKKLIKEKLKKWIESQKKIKIWQHLNNINRKKMLKIKKIKAQILYDDDIKLKILKQGK